MPTPIRFKGIVGTTAQIATDRFAGRIAFDSTLNRFVVFYDATNYATMARRDVLETFAAGVQDSTLTAGRVMLAGTSGRHSGDAGLTYTSSGGQLLSVGDGTSATARIIINGAASQTKGVRLQTAGVTRALLGVDTSDQTVIQSLDAAGLAIDTPVTIPNTAAAAIVFTRTLNTTGNLQTSGVTRISSAGAGSLTTLSTSGLATLQSVNITGLTASRMLSLDASKNVQSLDAAGSRSLIGAYGSGDNVSFGTLSTSGLATLAQATVSDLTTGRMVSTTTAGRLQSLDAAGSRSLIAAYGSGDNASFGTLSTSGLATLAQATVQDIADTRVVFGTTGGRLAGSAKLSMNTSGAANLVIGDGVVGETSALSLDAPAGNDGLISFRVANVSRWGMLRLATSLDFALSARNSSGVEIDKPITVVNASAGLITLGGSTLRPVNFTGAIQTTGVQRISAAGAASFTTLATTGLATLAQATVSDLTTGRMVSTTTAGRLQALDAAGSRSLIGAYGSGDNASLGTLATTGLATLAQATVSDLTTGRVVTTTTGGRLQALNYVPLGNTTLGVGEPRLCSGVSGGNLLIFSGLDVTDTAGSYGFLMLRGGAGTSSELASPGSLALSAPTGALSLSTASGAGGGVYRTQSSTTDYISGNIYNQYTTVTQTGIVTNQSLAGTGAGSRTIGAGRLNTAGSGMEVYLCGTYTTDGSAGSATIRIRLGSTTFRTIGSFTLDNSVTDGVWYIRGRITTRTTGATGTIGGQLMWEHQASSVAGSQVMHIETSTSSADVTLDLTASQVFDVDWTATDAGTSITCTCFSINLVR